MKINTFNSRSKTAGAVNALMTAAFLASASLTAPPAQAQAAPAKTQTASTKAPSVASLISLNKRIWGCVGWQIGRMETLRKYGIDIGSRCPR